MIILSPTLYIVLLLLTGVPVAAVGEPDLPPLPEAPPADLEAAREQQRREAFQENMDANLPMTQEQILMLRALLDKTGRAAATPAGTPPKPVSSAVDVSLEPGATPPVVRVLPGHATAVVMVDSTGEPWPIAGYINGNPQGFCITLGAAAGACNAGTGTGNGESGAKAAGKNSAAAPEENTLTITPLSHYAYSNVIVHLKDQPTPVPVSLVATQQEVDYRRELRILSLGPNASAPVERSLPKAANKVLLAFLNGVPPKEARVLAVKGEVGDVKGWRMGDKYYLRSSAPIISPAWLATMSSASGTRVYEMPPAPVVLMLQGGRTHQVLLEGRP